MQVYELGIVMGRVMSVAGTPVTYHQHGVTLTLVAVDCPAHPWDVLRRRYRRASILTHHEQHKQARWVLDVRQTPTRIKCSTQHGLTISAP